MSTAIQTTVHKPEILSGVGNQLLSEGSITSHDGLNLNETGSNQSNFQKINDIVSTMIDKKGNSISEISDEPEINEVIMAKSPESDNLKPDGIENIEYDTYIVPAGTKFEFHPDTNILPELSLAEECALENDLLEHGQIEPIDLIEGLIYDGRCKYSILSRANKPLIVREIKSKLTQDKLKSLIFSKNVARRHLTVSLRACLAYEDMDRLKIVWNKLSTEDNDFKKEIIGKCKSVRELAAQTWMVGDNSVGRAQRLYEGDKELFKKVRNRETFIKEVKFIDPTTKEQKTEKMSEEYTLSIALQEMNRNLAQKKEKIENKEPKQSVKVKTDLIERLKEICKEKKIDWEELLHKIIQDFINLREQENGSK